MSDENMKRANWIGAPAFYDLNMACVSIRQAFPDYGPFLVGSALERRDHRDVDVRCILSPEAFYALIGGEGWRARIQLLNAALSHYLARASGLPVDFQFQEQNAANCEFEGKPRSALGIFGGEPARPVKDTGGAKP